jgi:hypothetical protein
MFATWRTALDAAGIGGEQQRLDYTRCAQFIRDRDTGPYIGARLLGPPATGPMTSPTGATVCSLKLGARTGWPKRGAGCRTIRVPIRSFAHT